VIRIGEQGTIMEIVTYSWMKQGYSNADQSEATCQPENYEHLSTSVIEIGKRDLSPLHSQAQYSGTSPSSLPPIFFIVPAH